MTDLADITICVPARFHPGGLARLKDTFRVIEIERADPSLLTDRDRQAVRGVAASLTPIHASFIKALPQLEIIGNFGVGYDAVDTDAATASQVVVTHTPDVLDDEVADTAIGLLLMTLRELSKAEHHLRSGDWLSGNYRLTPLTLRGRRVGILGLGRIGRAIARRLEGFGVEIAYHNRRPVEGVGYRYENDALALARSADTIINVLPATPETDRLCNATFFAAMGPNGVFINVGRGSTVDEGALANVLETGAIAAAGLDVFATEPCLPDRLAACPNTVLLPHVASASVHTRQAMADLVVDNLELWFRERRVLTPVPESRSLLAGS